MLKIACHGQFELSAWEYERLTEISVAGRKSIVIVAMLISISMARA
jgi:hypothetical protein